MQRFFYWRRNPFGDWSACKADQRPAKPAEGSAPVVVGVRELTPEEQALPLVTLMRRYPRDEAQRAAETPGEGQEAPPAPEAPAETGRLSHDALRARMADALAETPPQSTWQHAGGTIYTVAAVALREGDCEPLVLYHKDGVAWARPMPEFKRRFTRI
jgi:hypothetical protein